MRTLLTIQKKNVRTRGFTLVEIIIVAAISGIVMIGVFALLRDTVGFNRSVQDSLRGQNEARRILRPFANEARGATRSVQGAYPIEMASTSEFIFFADTDEDGNAERIRYYLEGGSFKKSTIAPTGSPLSYDSDDEETIDIVHDVVATSTPVFTYYNTNYDSASNTAAISQPVSPSAVRLIKVTLTVDKDPNQPPAPFTITTQVSFRNLKSNL
jgi:prepilin-type N-terminal cleavage/methylation domain-containing protein